MVRRTLTPEEIDAIRSAAQRDDVLAAMHAFYADLDTAVAPRNPGCLLRGACCRFDEYGHNLFVTTLEAAYFAAHAPKRLPAVPCESRRGRAGADACPYQIGGRCSVRDARPTGCRIFFCDPSTRHWQGPLTEESLHALRTLHQRLGVQYVYSEWRNLLESLGL